MTEEEAQQRTIEIISLLKPKYNDISAHVDLVGGTTKINISIFWNRKSRDLYNEAKTFRIESSEYDKILNEKIKLL